MTNWNNMHWNLLSPQIKKWIEELSSLGEYWNHEEWTQNERVHYLLLFNTLMLDILEETCQPNVRKVITDTQIDVFSLMPPTITANWKIFSFDQFPHDTVIPTQLQTAWAMMLTQEDQILFSENIPEKFRKYAIYHESCCPISNKQSPLSDVSGKCSDALIIELWLAQEELSTQDFSEYIIWRISFFQGLIKYYNDQEQLDTSTIEDFEKSLWQLQQFNIY